MAYLMFFELVCKGFDFFSFFVADLIFFQLFSG